MTYKEYAQNIVKGCGRKLIQFPFVASADNCGEINPDNLQIELCLKCQRARQTATDLGKMELEDWKLTEISFKQNIDCCEGRLRDKTFKDSYRIWIEDLTESLIEIQDKIKDITEGLKILGEKE